MDSKHKIIIGMSMVLLVLMTNGCAAPNVANMSIIATESKLTYWVAPDGDDSNLGTEEQPFRTVTHALDLVPKIILHPVHIWLNPGYYNEDIIVDGFVCSRALVISGTTDMGEWRVSGHPELHRVNSVSVEHCKGMVLIQHIEAVTATKAGFSANVSGPKIEFLGVKVVTPSDKTGIRISQGSTSYIQLSVISNRGVAIVSERYSNAHLRENSGENNKVSLKAVRGALITTDGNQPAGERITGGGGAINWETEIE